MEFYNILVHGRLATGKAIFNIYNYKLCMWVALRVAQELLGNEETFNLKFGWHVA